MGWSPRPRAKGILLHEMPRQPVHGVWRCYAQQHLRHAFTVSVTTAAVHVHDESDFNLKYHYHTSTRATERPLGASARAYEALMDLIMGVCRNINAAAYTWK